MNGAWEVKGEEHAVLVRGVVDQLVRWFLGGTFRPRTDEHDWCMHIFRESNKAADTHANLLTDNDLHDKMQKHVILCCLSMGPEGRVVLVRLLGFCGDGMNAVSLRKSPTVVVCCQMPQQ